jgi:hypothetical protein
MRWMPKAKEVALEYFARRCLDFVSRMHVDGS